MQLERREAIELVLSSRASLLSQVATRLSSFDLKTTELKKSYKRSGALILKHREVKSCDERNIGPIRPIRHIEFMFVYSGAVSLGTAVPE